MTANFRMTPIQVPPRVSERDESIRLAESEWKEI
jgi:hypothetical protein